MFSKVCTIIFILTIFSYKVLEVTGDVNNTTGLIGMEEFLYQVSLHLSYNDEFLCGGSIVTTTEILTVAHCLFYNWGGVLPPIIISVQGGRNNLTDTPTLKFNVRKVTMHPLFDKGTLEYDLALIEVEGKFPSNVQIKAATTEKFMNGPSSLEDCYVTGWNRESNGRVTLGVDVMECDGVYSNNMGNICVKNKIENANVCEISTGSSLVCDNSLTGLLSIESNCNNTNQVTVFETIKSATNMFSDNTSSSAPVDFEVMKSNSLWSLLSALLSFILSLLL